eukprot:1771028-Rhodomonas_salina.1
MSAWQWHVLNMKTRTFWQILNMKTRTFLHMVNTKPTTVVHIVNMKPSTPGTARCAHACAILQSRQSRHVCTEHTERAHASGGQLERWRAEAMQYKTNASASERERLLWSRCCTPQRRIHPEINHKNPRSWHKLC